MQLPIVSFKKAFDRNDPEPCAACGDCCRYVTVQIKSPRSKADYDEIRWFLLHENIQVFVDEDGWYVEFATACRKLDDWRCTIYAERPLMCSEYEVEHCTRYGEGAPHVHLFTTEAEYIEYLRIHRPRAHSWVMDPRGERRLIAARGRARRAVPGSRAPECRTIPA